MVCGIGVPVVVVRSVVVVRTVSVQPASSNAPPNSASSEREPRFDFDMGILLCNSFGGGYSVVVVRDRVVVVTVGATG